MHSPSRIAVFRLYSKTDDEFDAIATAINRPNQIENRAGAEQRQELGREVHVC